MNNSNVILGAQAEIFSVPKLDARLVNIQTEDGHEKLFPDTIACHSFFSLSL